MIIKNIELIDNIVWNEIDPVGSLYETIKRRTADTVKYALDNLKGKNMVVEVTVREDVAPKWSTVNLRCTECGRKWPFLRKPGERIVKGAVGVWVLGIDKDNRNYPAMQIPCPDCMDFGYVTIEKGGKS